MGGIFESSKFISRVSAVSGFKCIDVLKAEFRLEYKKLQLSLMKGKLL